MQISKQGLFSFVQRNNTSNNATDPNRMSFKANLEKNSGKDRVVFTAKVPNSDAKTYTFPKKCIEDLDPKCLRGKTIFLRADLNAEADESGTIPDSERYRLKALKDDLVYLKQSGVKSIVLASHLGRPKGKVVESLRMNAVADALREVLKDTGISINKQDECFGDNVNKAINATNNGNIVLLENLRFYNAEKEPDPKAIKNFDLNVLNNNIPDEKLDPTTKYAKGLLSLPVDLYENAAFGTVHNSEDFSTVGFPLLLRKKAEKENKEVPIVGSKLMRDEDEIIYNKINNPARPLVMVISGKKIDEKIVAIEGALKNKLKDGDTLCIGGIIGNVVANPESAESEKTKGYAKSILKLVEDKKKEGININLVIPEDVVGGGSDIGPKTTKKIVAAIKDAGDKNGTVVIQGPTGWYEGGFVDATEAVLNAAAKANKAGATTVAAGGNTLGIIFKLFGTKDRLESVKKLDDMGYLSTGGGAVLAYLEDKPRMSIDALDDASKTYKKYSNC